VRIIVNNVESERAIVEIETTSIAPAVIPVDDDPDYPNQRLCKVDLIFSANDTILPIDLLWCESFTDEYSP
jgi:hypothetical protein